MLNYDRLRKRPKQFKSFTGLSVDEFDQILHKIKDSYKYYENKRLNSKKRKRAIGGGRKFKNPLCDRILMCIINLRLNLTQIVLGYLFNLSDSNVCRDFSRIMNIIKEILPTSIYMTKKGKKISSLEELYEIFPDLKAIVDAEEQPIQRPKDKEKQKKYYSGKKKRHTIKKQIVVNKDGLIFNTSTKVVEGKKHDYKLFKDEQTMDKIPKEIEIMGDLGFKGMDKDFPDRIVHLPHKATKKNPLDDRQKKENKDLSKIRVVVEHAIGRLKVFKILSDRYRHPLNSYDSIFEVITGLVNFKTIKRLNLAIA